MQGAHPALWAPDPRRCVCSVDGHRLAFDVDLSGGTDARRIVGVLADSLAYVAVRDPVNGVDADRFAYDGGLAVMGSGPARIVHVQAVQLAADHEASWALRDLLVSDGDSTHVRVRDGETFHVFHGGAGATYSLEMSRGAAAGSSHYHASGVALPAGAAEDIVVDWSDPTLATATIRIDHGNDGTIDDSLVVANDLGQATSTGEPGGGAAPGVRFASRSVQSRGSVRFALTQPTSGHVRLDVFDAAGRHVAVPVDAVLPPGETALTWNGRDTSGVPVGTGLYIVRFVITPRGGGVPVSGVRRVVLIP